MLHLLGVVVFLGNIIVTGLAQARRSALRLRSGRSSLSQVHRTCSRATRAVRNYLGHHRAVIDSVMACAPCMGRFSGWATI